MQSASIRLHRSGRMLCSFRGQQGACPPTLFSGRAARERAREGIGNEIVKCSSGFLDVSVSPDEVTVEYIKNIYDCERDCGEVVDSYTIPAK